MLFNSPVYIFLFLPVVVLGYFLFNHFRLVVAAKAWLVLSSLFFYGFWNPSYLTLIIGSMLANFALGTALHREKRTIKRGKYHHLKRKNILAAGVLFNLGLLGYFKYADFLIENFNLFLGQEAGYLNLGLPLAISFFTFQQIAYLVDSYQQDTREYDFLNYCLFVTFFPQLIAGPIVHHSEMMPQFMKLRTKILDWRNVGAGVFIFSIGLFKKVVIADSFAIWANAGFDAAGPLGFYEAWGTSLSYTFQLYYDFSGYTDMAIGAALLFNIRLPINFNSPYKAIGIQDFWRRWHITLSRWLRDYVYIPLGGSRKGESRTYTNLLVTFILGGLWHGAGWTFIIWGAMHGIALSVERLWGKYGIRLYSPISWFITFFFVNWTWVVFRAESFGDALKVYRGMLGMNGSGYFPALETWADISRPWQFFAINKSLQGGPVSLIELVYLLVFSAIAFLAPNTVQMIGLAPSRNRLLFQPSPGTAVLLAFLFFVANLQFLGNVVPGEFLYFNF